MQIEDKRKHKT